MARIGYARVSTTGQNLDMQIAALEKSNCDRIFVEKVSGVKERPELQAALKFMRAGDTLVVYKFDRIGRSLKDLVNIFADLQKRDITLISLKDNIDATTNSGKFMMNVFAALAEFERTIIIERTTSLIVIHRIGVKTRGALQRFFLRKLPRAVAARQRTSGHY